jgi:acetyltransferase
MKNLITGGFRGDLYPVNPKYEKVMALKACRHISEIKRSIDLAVIAAPIKSVPDIVAACGKTGCAGVAIISSGGKEIGKNGRRIEEQIQKAAQAHQVRVIGPNCLGFINTTKAVNASFAHLSPLAGSMAFISQSGAVCTSVLDLAHREKIGFSHFISLGSMMDVDFADMIDYLGSLRSVESIVMYMENITNIRNFMSAARMVSRVKPIIALKSGRSASGARAAASHTGALAGEDAAYDAAFRRAGILRVNEFEELLDCSQFLAKLGKASAPGLTILTNAGGPGVMAADALESHGMKPAVLSRDTIRKLNRILPRHWSHDNPVDILGDSPPETYIEAAKICAGAPETNALLLICSPAGTMDTLVLAKRLVDSLSCLPCPVITAWIGGDKVLPARQVLNQAGIATYESAERAVRAFKNLYHYNRNIETLVQIPVRTDKKLLIRRPQAEGIISKALENNLPALTEIQAKNLLTAYGIPVNQTRLALSSDMAVEICRDIGYPVVLKICSRHILHKSDCNGVALDIKTAPDVKKAFEQILNSARDYAPEAVIDGITVQPFRQGADYELIIGARKDPGFGPVILFGMGGILAEVFRDTSIGLPPLNRLLARQMIDETRISQVLSGYRHIKKINFALLEEILIRTSRLVTDFPQITELDINPLLVKNGSLTCVDARVLLRPCDAQEPSALVISTYPFEYEKKAATVDGQPFFIRPIRPSDADLLIAHFHSLSPRSVYMRFFSPVKQLSHPMLIKLTQIDYDREVALVALVGKKKQQKMVGVCRIIFGPDKNLGEFAMAISDDWQGRGIGSALLSQCIKAAKDKGVKKIMGVVLAENTQMLMLSRKMGFVISRIPGCAEFEITVDCEKTA